MFTPNYISNDLETMHDRKPSHPAAAQRPDNAAKLQRLLEDARRQCLRAWRRELDLADLYERGLVAVDVVKDAASDAAAAEKWHSCVWTMLHGTPAPAVVLVDVSEGA